MELTHVDSSGRVVMVDVSDKPIIKRTAIASGHITLSKNTIMLIKEGQMKKGDPLTCARIAGIMAAKKTGDLIPLCHPLSIDQVSVDLEIIEDGVNIESKVITTAKTGIEMEALTAVSIAALTIYDMCKAVDKNMVIDKVTLVSKTKEPL